MKKILVIIALAILLNGIVLASATTEIVGNVNFFQKILYFLYGSQNAGIMSVVGQNRQCDVNPLTSGHFLPNTNVNLQASNYCSSGQSLFDIYFSDDNKNSYFPYKEYKNSASLLCGSSHSDCVWEVYCCDKPECTTNSDCVNWYGSGYQCVVGEADNYIPYDGSYYYCKGSTDGQSCQASNGCLGTIANGQCVTNLQRCNDGSCQITCPITPPPTTCTSIPTKKCDTAVWQDYPSCSWDESSCGGITQPNLIEYSKAKGEYIGNNQIKTTFYLKNTGVSMTSNWILEIQPDKSPTGIMSIISPNELTCDATHPENVHKEFKLDANEQAEISLTMTVPDADVLINGNTYVLPIITEYCGCTQTSCYKAPYLAGNADTIGQVQARNIASNITQSYTLSDTKKLALSKEDIGISTSQELLASTCLKSSECYASDTDKYLAKCHSIASLREDKTLSETDETSFFDNAKLLTKGIFYGGAAGTIICFASAVIGGVTTASGAGALVGIPLLTTSAAVCGSFGALLGVTATQVYLDVREDDSLVKALKAKDANSVGICTLEEIKASLFDTFFDWAGEWAGEENRELAGYGILIGGGILLIYLLTKK